MSTTITSTTLDTETKTTLAEELDDIALELAMPCEDSTSNADLFQQIYAEIERLRDTAELYEFVELTPVATWVLDNIKQLKTNLNDLKLHHEQGHYYTWIELLATLLREQDASTQALLIAELNADLHQATWSSAIDNTHLQRLFTALSIVPLTDLGLDLHSDPHPNQIQNQNQNQDQNTSYRLAWDEDIHPELLEAFLIETPDLAIETAALIRAISAGDADKASQQKAARFAHTIKGSSAVVGVEAIANFAHQLEDVLEHSFATVLPPAANECLLESADCLEALFDSLQTQTTPPSQYPRLLQQLTDWDKKLQQGDIVFEVEVEADTNTDTGVDTKAETKTETNGEEPEENITIEKTETETETQADPELAWNHDIHPELLAAYLSETPQHIQQVSEQLRTMSNSKQTIAEQHPIYQQTALLAHTLKGSSATVEVSAIVKIATTLEAILDALLITPEGISLTPQQSHLFTTSADLLENLYQALIAKTSLPENYQRLLTQLTTWQQQLENPEAHSTTIVSKPTKLTKLTKPPVSTETVHKAEEITTAPIKSKPKEEKTQQQASKKKNKISFQLPPMRTIQPIITTPQNTNKPILKTKSRIANEATLRVPISLIEKLLNLSNELITSNTQLTEYAQTLLNDKRTMHDRNERIRNLVDELEWTVNRQSSFHAQYQNQQELSEFDALEMDNYNALHSVSNLLAETTNDAHETSLALIKQFNVLKEHLTEQQKINKALNSNVLAMRMEPVTRLTPRLERIVRETCRQTNKKASLTITGTDLALDTDVLKSLLDPLLHLLRNAVDHGIESPAQRKKNNKASKGKIHLHFKQQGTQVLLTLKDDGAGMDAEAIYQQALNKDLIAPDSVLSDHEKLRLILQAGFSTRKEVSKISGRGVGMDVVNTAVNDLSGSIHLHSEQGIGTEIQIQVPLTLAAANVLLVEISKHILAIPSTAIEQITYLEQGATQYKQEKLFIRFEQDDIPLLSLSSLLDWPVSHFNDSDSQAIIIVRHHEDRYAFYFDQMMNFQEIVLKTLKPWMEKIRGINGVCLLQNGVVAPVLNLTELLTEIPQHAFTIPTTTQHQGTALTTSHGKNILVVDDSLSNRKALSLTIEPLGYQVTTAVDGADAITKLEKKAFDLVITDLEMPIMNGIQLTEYIRGQHTIQHIPVVMVTSRSTTKHRTLATKAGVNDYLTKPVNKPTLKACLDTYCGENNHEHNIENKIKQ